MDFSSSTTRQAAGRTAVHHAALATADHSLTKSATKAWGIWRVGQPDAPGAGMPARSVSNLSFGRMYGSAKMVSGGAPDSLAV